MGEALSTVPGTTGSGQGVVITISSSWLCGLGIVNKPL